MWKSQRHTCTLCIIWITYTRKIWIRFPHVPCKPPIMTGNLGISHLNRHWEWIFQSVKSYLNWSSVRTLSSGPSEHLKYLSQSLPAPGTFPKPKRDSDFTPTSTWQTLPSPHNMYGQHHLGECESLLPTLAEEESVWGSGHPNQDQTPRLSSNRCAFPALWGWKLDHLQQTYKNPRAVPPVMPSEDPSNQLGRKVN